ncbi:MAG: MBL fold metallo-hydrolase [Endomicrobia bacterium]|nr:MBL fold metallo-hydrolase [Endomicrobiia bacterium]MCL2799434.1 MBL fold metallo-hydrolase [Endomicrobiia bacterium]
MKKLTAFIFILIFSVIVWADVTVTPYGAAGMVSGSCFLLEAEGKKIIIDCGLFMEDNDNEENSDSKNFYMPEELINADALILTHAHLDHSGRIPLLINKGFKGKIYSTRATKELALALFRERNGFDLIERKWFWSQSQKNKSVDSNTSVVIHWKDNCRKNIKTIEESNKIMLLSEVKKEERVPFRLCKECSAKEAENIEKFFITKEYGEESLFQEISFPEGINFKFIDAGHVPGSASVMFAIKGRKILFSGDLGSGYSRLNGMFDIPQKADVIFVESTYAGKRENFSKKGYDIFRKDLEEALSKGKIVWIPALSFNRTQKVLYELKLMQDAKMLSENISIYSVSPSANAITSAYQKELLKNTGEWFFEDVYKTGTILPENTRLQPVRSYDKQMILISSSGDMDKGMSGKFVSKLVPKDNVFIMIVNYVRPSSNAGKLLAGKGLAGVKTRAKIKKYEIFSDHPDFDTLEKWLSKQNKDAKIFLIHSDDKNSSAALKSLKRSGYKNVFKTRTEEKIDCVN